MKYPVKSTIYLLSTNSRIIKIYENEGGNYMVLFAIAVFVAALMF